MNEIANATNIPRVIIQPKSMTGRMLLTTKDAKATAVVSTVYKQGLVIDETVSVTS